MIQIDDQEIITSVRNIDKKIIDDPRILINRFFLTCHDGHVFTHYGWVTQHREIIHFERDTFENYFKEKTINRELLVKLDDKYSIECYIQMLEL